MQAEVKLEMKNSGNQMKTSKVTLTNKVQDMEKRISGIEDKVENWIPQSEKMLNLKINPGINIQETWDIMKRQFYVKQKKRKKMKPRSKEQKVF